MTFIYENYPSFDSDSDFQSACWNVSQCYWRQLYPEYSHLDKNTLGPTYTILFKPSLSLLFNSKVSEAIYIPWTIHLASGMWTSQDFQYKVSSLRVAVSSFPPWGKTFLIGREIQIHTGYKVRNCLLISLHILYQATE